MLGFRGHHGCTMSCVIGILSTHELLSNIISVPMSVTALNPRETFKCRQNSTLSARLVN